MQHIFEDILKYGIIFWKWVGIIMLSWLAILLMVGGPIILVREIFVYFFGRDKVYRFLNKDYDNEKGYPSMGGPMSDM